MTTRRLADLAIDVDRVTAELDRLATFSDCPRPAPAMTRVVFTETDIRAREYLATLYRRAGLQVRVDAIGNTFARWVGSEPDLPAVATGSHTDAIPFSGMYDGTVGVLGGLEAIRSLQAVGHQPRRSIELVMFTSEEPTRFGVGCTGSRLLADASQRQTLESLRDGDGVTYDRARRDAGFSGDLDDVTLPEGHYHAWIELHIEQGPELERLGLPIGIVTAIAAPATLQVSVEGQGGHAGAVLMDARRDALTAAAEMILRIEQIARSSPTRDQVATVGRLDVHPGAVNSIPSGVTFSIDLRDIHGDHRDAAKSRIEDAIADIAGRRNVHVTVTTLNQDPPAVATPWVVDAARSGCEQAGLAHTQMVSRAYHDSLFMAKIAPMTMLFIPCRDGRSHRPDEYSSPQQIAAGIQVLARTLAILAE